MSALVSHPRLLDCRRVFLRNYAVDAYIGIYEREHGVTQRVLVNVDVYIPLALSNPQQDDIGEVLDYDFIRNAVKERLAQGHVRLQETLCDDIARRMLAHPQVRAARVATEKREAYPDCEGVGVEVFHIKDSP
jgi:dihydroneopterin aldolase